MQQFKQSDTIAVLIFTLNENVTINDPYFLMAFKHILTKTEVKFIKFVTQDESITPARYNKFTINPSTIFLNKPIGQWNYTIYEQASSTNTDVLQAGAVLEHGKMILDRATPFEFKAYNEAQSFNAYNG